MRRVHILTVTAAALGACASAGCNGVAMPGRTAGNTWGGSHSHQLAKKKAEPKAEPKKESKAKTYPPGAPGPHDRTGLITRVKDGRLWIFRDRTKDLAEFDKGTPSEKHVTFVGAGPDGMTVKAPDAETFEAWTITIPGFEVWVRDGRAWVARPQSLDWLWLRTGNELGKHVSLVGAGPNGMTIRAGDTATAEAYATAAAAAGVGA